MSAQHSLDERPASHEVLPDGSRVTFGADEFVFTELAHEMSIETTLRVLAIADAVRDAALPGVVDVCPANVSYLIRITPESISPHDVVTFLSEVHRSRSARKTVELHSRIIDIPVLYDDPWTRETLLRFRDRHQEPRLTDVEYAAQVNGFTTTVEFIEAHSKNPFIATFIGFVPGNAESYQLVPRALQLEVPKYVRPRTDTPARALGHGGAFSTIYPVRGAGGYQLLGRSPVPVFDPTQRLFDFRDSMVLPRSGDIFKYRPIQPDEYFAIRADVESGSYKFRLRNVSFSVDQFLADPSAYNRRLLEVLASD